MNSLPMEVCGIIGNMVQPEVAVMVIHCNTDSAQRSVSFKRTAQGIEIQRFVRFVDPTLRPGDDLNQDPTLSPTILVPTLFSEQCVNREVQRFKSYDDVDGLVIAFHKNTDDFKLEEVTMGDVFEDDGDWFWRYDIVQSFGEDHVHLDYDVVNECIALFGKLRM